MQGIYYFLCNAYYFNYRINFWCTNVLLLRKINIFKKTIDYKSAEILVNLAKTNNLGNNDVMIYSKGEVEKNSNVYSVKLKGGQIITIMTTKDN